MNRSVSEPASIRPSPRAALQPAASISNGPTLALLAANGLFDEARLQIDHLIGAYPGDVSLGPIMAWYEGRIAGVEPSTQEVKVTARTDIETLSTVYLPKFLFVPA